MKTNSLKYILLPNTKKINKRKLLRRPYQLPFKQTARATNVNANY